MKKILPFLLGAIFFVGCKPQTETPAPVDPLVALKEKAQTIAAQQVPIEASEVPQASVRSATLILIADRTTTLPVYNFRYTSQNKLTGISANEEDFWNLIVEDKQATITYSGLVGKYTLNESGIGEKATITYEGKSNEMHYLYKNGYWVSSYGTDGTITTRAFSKEGNLLQWQTIDKYGSVLYNATYEYTDIPNTIRQEINRWEAVHFAFRGDVLGKYSTHLVSKATINGINILNFEYTKDNANRVKNISIKRTQGTFELPVALYTYTYD